MKKNQALPQHPAVNQNAPIGIDQAISWLASGERVHSMMLTGFYAGADMDRDEIGKLIKDAGGAYQTDPKAAFPGHLLAVWVEDQATKDASARFDPKRSAAGKQSRTTAACGYWLFFETNGATPPAARQSGAPTGDPIELMRKILHVAVGDDAKDWEDADGIEIGSILTAALAGDLETAARELAAYEAVLAEAEASAAEEG